MPNPPKKQPVRQCLGCRERKLKRELVRIVRSPEGAVSLDFTGKANGRGAYLCHNPECLRRAVKSRALERAFGAAVPEEVYERLAAELETDHVG
ncbi:MAG: YlxR family protein [Oscillospiraceae bacterium]|nr:YlxR family protein [Oscillospiraceae bacterium]